MGCLRNRSGLSLIETLIGMMIMALVALTVARNVMMFGTQSTSTKDKSFAIQKSIQMMEELRGLIATNNANIGVLDDYDNGTAFSDILTTDATVTDPADATSGNGNLKFKRQISVVSVPNEATARRVYVRVFYRDSGDLAAETMSILRTIRNDYVPTQVMDIYILALENVPGWWVAISSMKPMLDSILQDLETRNPGLELRTHWITRLSYGRDPYYTPYTNDTVYSTSTAASQWVYLYPGHMVRSGADFYYYSPSNFGSRINVDGTVANASSYSLADQYNHAVRYPDEVRLYNAAVSAAQAAGQAEPEMSLRMLIEKMNTSPAELSNLLLINLHGELMPLPPIRNYSDAAKEPSGYPDVRVVTHPEQLSYNAGAEVRLRVYPYVMNPSAVSQTATLSTATVFLPSLTIGAGNITVRKMLGNGITQDYSWTAATAGTDYSVTNLSSGTVVTLWNSPIRHSSGTLSARGLAPARRLYGLEYIPCEVNTPQSGTAFIEGLDDLSVLTSTAPKNTARWVIRLAPGSVPNGEQAIETRIGTDLTTGSAGNQPTNLSRTYVWVNATVPMTERYQFIGDPRHMPYHDVKANLGYNWYWTSPTATEYKSFTNTANGWHGRLNIDVPRMFYVVREGLLTSGGIWNSITGFSFFYVGIGNEMGADASNGFPSGLQLVETPWSSGSSSVAGVDEITSNGVTHNQARLIADTGNTWRGLYWLGELYPDSHYSVWAASGNLNTGSGQFYRARFSTSINGAATLSYQPQKRTAEQGSASMMNGNPAGDSASYFNHEYADSANGTLTADGSTMSSNYNYPLVTPITAPRPFVLNYTGSGRQPAEWATTAYVNSRTTLSWLEDYYNSSYSGSYRSSALIKMIQGSDQSYWVMNGLGTQSNFGSAEMGKFCITSMLRAFHSAGSPLVPTNPITQIPLLSITHPRTTDPLDDVTSIGISWDTQWSRWDGQAYSEDYPSPFTGSATIKYLLKYSTDNGRHWKYMSDNAAAVAGEYDGSYAVTSSPYTWNVAGFPRGSYIIRVEGYREGYALHYTYHQREIYINN